MSSRSVASSIKKKRKLTSTTTSQSHEPSSLIENITQLTHDSIIAIADYLPKTSRALLAVTLTAPSSSFRGRGTGEISEASRAIITSKKLSNEWPGKIDQGILSSNEYQYYNGNWTVLDMFDIKGLAEKLTDDDVYAILVCIDAKHKLKKARLSKCTKLVGNGLEPLRGSVVLEHITAGDQSYYYPSPSNRNKPLVLSHSVVIPILDSIVSTDGNSLRELSLPKRWNVDDIRNEQPLSGFFAKFNQIMLTTEVKCVSCPVLCAIGNNENSCQICFKRTCATCDEEGEDGWFDPDEQPFIKSCNRCNMSMCHGCGRFKGCSECNSVFCAMCAKEDDVDAGQYCENAGYGCDKEAMCLGCRIPEEQEGCWGCQSLVFPKLMAENKRLAEENKRLHKENDEH